MAKTRFGRGATGEADLVDSLRAGRAPSLRILNKMSDFMEAEDQKLADASLGKGDDFPDTDKAVVS